jgi:hypothetical protein
VHHVDTYTPAFIVEDLRTAASRLRERMSALLRRLAAQRVSDQWVEQHQRDAAKH